MVWQDFHTEQLPEHHRQPCAGHSANNTTNINTNTHINNTTNNTTNTNMISSPPTAPSNTTRAGADSARSHRIPSTIKMPLRVLPCTLI